MTKDDAAIIQERRMSQQNQSKLQNIFLKIVLLVILIIKDFYILWNTKLLCHFSR